MGSRRRFAGFLCVYALFLADKSIRQYNSFSVPSWSHKRPPSSSSNVIFFFFMVPEKRNDINEQALYVETRCSTNIVLTYYSAMLVAQLANHVMLDGEENYRTENQD